MKTLPRRRRLKVRIKGDDETFTADSAYDLVGKLNDSSFQPERNRRAWMKEAAERGSLQTGRRIRHDTPRHFLTDVKRAGIITDVRKKRGR